MATKVNDIQWFQEQRDHVLHRPGTYIGSCKSTSSEEWVFSEEAKEMDVRNVTYVPGLLKIFNEVIDNARDASIRDTSVTQIKVTINKETGLITVWNNGSGIEIKEHKKFKMLGPEIIFGHLNSGTNYDDSRERVGVGVNGVGVKAANIFSTKFGVECTDGTNKFVQVYKDNMKTRSNPKVTSNKGKPYVKVAFQPDYKKFGLKNGLTDDIYDLFTTSVVYTAATTDKRVNVYLNGTSVGVKDFEKFMDLYLGPKKDAPRVFHSTNRWQVGLAIADSFDQVSFVNGMHTPQGGTHVKYITNQVIKGVKEALSKKKETKGAKINNSYIEQNLFVFVSAIINQPDFGPQTKDSLHTKSSEFGSTCKLPDKFITDFIKKTDIINRVAGIVSVKDMTQLAKTSGTKKSKVIIDKLEDANWAGTKRSKECTLFIVEGDSAKTFAMAGFSVVGRDQYGVFPLRGKLLNVRDASSAAISKNKEIQALFQILGLKYGQKYNDTNSLRYGRICILTDADVDGSHIKGLTINFIEKFWPGLIKCNFVSTLSTPVVKATKGNSTTKIFYTLPEFEDWIKTVKGNGGYFIKYYKGLGTSTAKEAKEIFTDLKSKMTIYSEDKNTRAFIDLAFKKDQADNRKVWLQKYDKESQQLKKVPKTLGLSEFIHKDLVLFSVEDNMRSLPSLVDGLKPSQRKIIWLALNRPGFTEPRKEMKVVAYAGALISDMAYHHGDTSAAETIVSLAQDYVGANNINLLMPQGGFGCVDPETLILLWNGEVKKAKNITIEDKLVGDDGKIRNITKIVNGEDDMYKISQHNRDDYIVNSMHILTLKYSGHKTIFWRESDKSWWIAYFDPKDMKSKQKSVRTVESTVNDHHNSSKLSKQDAYEKIKKFGDTIPDNDIFDINIQDYLKLSKTDKYHFKGISNSTSIEWESKKTSIDPYVFGLWLGDGDHTGNGFTCHHNDIQLVKKWCKWLDTIGGEIVHHKGCGSISKIHDNYHYTIRRRGSGYKPAIGSRDYTSDTCDGCQSFNQRSPVCDWVFEEKQTSEVKINGTYSNGVTRYDMHPFREILKRLNLYKNKHIPIEYIVNDEYTRLQLLAGFIDTDGCIGNTKETYFFRIAQSIGAGHENLIDSLNIISRSLGFNTSTSITNQKNSTMKELRISGNNIYKIPTKLERKKITRNMCHTSLDVHSCKIEVNKLKNGKYCGWYIDSNERFLLGDFTITHNTRIQGGKDHASSRYINTYLNPISKFIFNSSDNDLLNILEDDGKPIEPEHLVPILPMVLVNGSMGIGTGFSTNVPCYNPEDIKDNLVRLMKGQEMIEMVPWYRGFTGTIRGKKDNNSNFESLGTYKQLDKKTVVITELPVGRWTENYKAYLQKMELDGGGEISFTEGNTDTKVEFTVTFKDPIEPDDDLVSYLGLSSKGSQESKMLSTSNMYLFDANGKIKKYESPLDIIKEFYHLRLDFYDKRKKHLCKVLEKEIDILSEKARFIRLVSDHEILVFKQKTSVILEKLKEYKFRNTKELLDIRLHQFTEENIKKFNSQVNEKSTELEELKKKPIKNMWAEDLGKI